MDALDYRILGLLSDDARRPFAELARKNQAQEKRSGRLEAIGALGIFDAGTARGLAVAGYGAM